ncbi:MAG: aspartate aminotransferase family protein, partial [Deltaproteobacteria bacterium]
LVEQAHDRFLATNGLNPMAFQSLKRMEEEVVAMSASLLHAPPEASGTMTSGGTESIILAVKTWRDRAAARRRIPARRPPEVVAPVTVHPAFAKACHLLGMRLRTVAVDRDGLVDPSRLLRAIGRRTVLVVASAPQYPHGAVDPIPEIAAGAARRGVPMHVDACFGGFLLPWLERLGVTMPTWDFRVPGVQSISADLHKYGYAAKGASVLLYRDASTLRHQFYVSTDWPGGIYASPGLAGTRPGGPIAAAWAALQGLGEAGYLDLTRQTWEAAEALRAGIADIAALRLLGQPHSSIVTWTAADDRLDIYAVADLLQARGWSVDRQQDPPAVHCSCTPANLPVIPRYLADLRECVDEALRRPDLAFRGDAAVYGMMARVPVRGLVRKGVLDLMEQMYGADPEAPSLSEAPALPAWGQRALDRVDRLRRRLRGAA